MNSLKQIATLITMILFFSCSGGSNTSSETGVEATPGPVDEMDKSRYNLNTPDELLHEMQDSLGIGGDTIDSPAELDTMID